MEVRREKACLTNLLDNPCNELIQRKRDIRLRAKHMPHVLLVRRLVHLVVEQLLHQVQRVLVEARARVDALHEKGRGPADVVHAEGDGEGVDKLGVVGGEGEADGFEGVEAIVEHLGERKEGRPVISIRMRAQGGEGVERT
jgi:hypothetical protein